MDTMVGRRSNLPAVAALRLFPGRDVRSQRQRALHPCGPRHPGYGVVRVAGPDGSPSQRRSSHGMARFWARGALRAILRVLMGPSPRQHGLGDYCRSVARTDGIDPQRTALATTAVGIRSRAFIGIGLFGPRIVRSDGTPGVAGLRGLFWAAPGISHS